MPCEPISHLLTPVAACNLFLCDVHSAMQHNDYDYFFQGIVDAGRASRHAALLSHFGGCRSCHTLDSCHSWKQYSRRCENHSWELRTTTTASQFTSLNGQERSITNGHFPRNWPNRSEQLGDTTVGGVSDRTSERRFLKSVTFQHHSNTKHARPTV